jgi:hypothetical protein
VSEPTAAADAVIAALLDALRGLRYGSIEIVVHDARVVHIERREKLRLDSPAGAPTRADRTAGGSPRTWTRRGACESDGGIAQESRGRRS